MEVGIKGNPGQGNTYKDTHIEKVGNYNPNATKSVQVIVGSVDDARRVLNSDTAVVDGEVVNMNYLSTTLDPSPSREIIRSNYLDLITKHLKSNNVLCLTGDRGVGKSVLLEQFARSHPENCVCFFYNGMDRSDFDPEIFAHDITAQLYWYSYHDSNSYNEQLVDEISLEKVVYPARRKAKNSDKPLYFVFDGLDKTPIEIKDSILNILGKVLWTKNTRYIFSGSQNDIKKLLGDNTKWSFCEDELPNFSEAEVRQYFSKANKDITDDHYQLLYEVTHGNAARMDGVWRKFVDKDRLTELWNSDPKALEDLYADDLKMIKENEDGIVLDFFTLLTYAMIPMTVAIASKTFGITEDEVRDLACRYKDYMSCNDDILRLHPDGFRKYLIDNLSENRKAVDMKLIPVLESKEYNAKYCNVIPSIMKSDDMPVEIINYLNAENTRNIMVNKESQASFDEQCEFGYDAWTKRKEHFLDSAFRFALNKTSTREIERNELWDHEIEALMSIGEYDKAMARAQGIFLAEERLKALLQIAQHRDSIPHSDFDALKDNIEQLVESIDFEKIPELSMEIAPLLFPIDYIAAVKIVDRIANKNPNDINTDTMYTLFSMISQRIDPENGQNKRDLVSSIKDDEARQFAHTARNLFNNIDTDEFLKELDSNPNKNQELKVLFYWLPAHNDKPGIGKAVLRAIQLIVEVSDTEMPKAQILSSICKSMKTMSKEEMEEALDYINPLEDSIRYPTIDYVDAKLTIIEALKDKLPDEALKMLEKLYYTIDEIKDKALQLTCLSKFLGKYDKLGDKRVIEREILSTVDLRKEIMDGYEKLLSETALHMKLLDGTISALVCSYPTMVEELISEMNTEYRRSEAYAYAADQYIQQEEKTKINVGFFFKLLSESELDDRRQPLLSFAKVISHAKDLDNDIILKGLKENFHYFDELERSVDRCITTMRIYIWIKKNFPDDSFADTVRETMFSSLKTVGGLNDKITLGFNVAEHISRVSKDEARDIVNHCLALKERKGYYLSSASCIDAFNLGIRLYEDSLRQLIKLNLCSEERLDLFDKETEPITWNAEKIIMWSNIALEYRLANNTEMFIRIADRHLSIDYSNYSPFVQKCIMYNISPVLYFQNSEHFFNELSHYDDEFRNGCIARTCIHIITKQAPPCGLGDKKDAYELSFHDCQDILSLLSHCTEEDAYLRFLEIISTSFRSANQHGELVSWEQKEAIINRGKKLVEKNLPTKRGIQHEGYKIACLATLEYGLGKFGHKEISKWDSQIKTISNAADRAFLYFLIGPLFSETADIIKMIKKGIETAATVHSKFEESSRLDMAVTECVDNNLSGIISKVAKKAMASLTADSSFDDYENLIDTVYDYKPDLASKLVESLDKDPARLSYKKRLLRHLDTNKKLSEARKGDLSIEKLTTRQKKMFFDQGLKHLKDGTGQPYDVTEAFKVTIPVIFNGNLRNTYSTIGYLLTTVGKKQEVLGTQSDLLYKMHDAIRHNLKVVLTLGAGTKERLDKVDSIINDHLPDTDTSKSLSRNKAIENLISWYKETNCDELVIVDNKFSIADLHVLKHLNDINSKLAVHVLTHRCKESIETYTEEWHKISNGIRVPIQIDFVYYQDIDVFNSNETTIFGPLTDRCWIAVDDDEDRRVGVRLSVNEDGQNTSFEIIPMTDADIINTLYQHSRYVEEKVHRKNDHPLEYKHIKLE